MKNTIDNAKKFIHSKKLPITNNASVIFWAEMLYNYAKKCESKTKMTVKCPECLQITTQEELDTFGGLCEECSGAFDFC